MNKYIDCKIYDIDYLRDEELSEQDIYNLFDTNSLLYSLLIGQFRYLRDVRPGWQIIKECKEDKKWIENHKFNTKKDFQSFKNDITKIFKNIYQYSDEYSENRASWFMFQFGFQYKND